MALYLVTTNVESGEIKLEEFEALDGMLAVVKKLLQEPDKRFFAFDGQRIGVSKAPFRYLLVGEQKFPLFDLPQDVEEDAEFGCSSPEPAEVFADAAYVALSNSVLSEESSDETAPSLPDLED